MSEEIQVRKIAEEMGIQFYARYSEKKAAEVLGISPATLQRKRFAGDISCLKISERVIQYFGRHLVAFILASEERAAGQSTNPASPQSKANSVKTKATQPDKADVLAAAKRILG